MTMPPNQERIFTRAGLATFNGQGGRPAYVAVNGLVFDVTTVFLNGSHFQHLAGQELTGAFLRQHDPATLSRYPVVGRLPS